MLNDHLLQNDDFGGGVCVCVCVCVFLFFIRSILAELGVLWWGLSSTRISGCSNCATLAALLFKHGEHAGVICVFSCVCR